MMFPVFFSTTRKAQARRHSDSAQASVGHTNSPLRGSNPRHIAKWFYAIQVSVRKKNLDIVTVLNERNVSSNPFQSDYNNTETHKSNL